MCPSGCVLRVLSSPPFRAEKEVGEFRALEGLLAGTRVDSFHALLCRTKGGGGEAVRATAHDHVTSKT